MNIAHNVTKGSEPFISACAGACAATGIELAETVIGYIMWVGWCTSTFCAGGIDG